MKNRKPLKLKRDNWRSRWLVTDARFLHRISRIRWESDPPQKIYGRGVAICGRIGHWHMPGIFSRMGMLRCPYCCRIMGIRNGRGAPFNSKIWELGDRKPFERTQYSPGRKW